MDVLDDVLGYSLDSEQRNVVMNESKNCLVVAGAGSGKTLTIVGKIRYLFEVKKLKQNEVLCISFTNETVNSLKNKLLDYYGYDVDVYTFHKLSLKILRFYYDNIGIINDDYLDYIILEYFNGYILENNNSMYNVLRYFKVKNLNKNNIEFKYKKFIKYNSIKINSLGKIISKFIKLFKGKNYNVFDFYRILKKNSKSINIFNKGMDRLFLLITFDIYLLYEEELRASSKLDFDDMINRALDVVDYRIDFKYKYIIVDEYQDTSYIKVLLLKKIQELTNASILAVGDDFQSIYRFTGCDLNVFLDFDKYYDDVSILKITNTYRNSQELIDICGKFIMKNKRQITKNLKSKKRLDNPLIIVNSNDQCLDLKKILSLYNDEEIMILGRNNNDIYKVIDSDFEIDGDKVIYKKNLSLNIRYLTVHRSKGLEANIVILINVIDDVMGFPSKIKDERVINYVLDKKDVYPYEEERRLFYVALTRTRNYVYVICDKSKKSIFVKEIEQMIKNK